MINPFRSEIQLKAVDQKALKTVVEQVQKRGVGVFYNQNLDQKSFVEVIKRIGECEKLGQFMNPEEFPEISLVTSQRDSLGKKKGMFGDGELGWHSNGNSRHMVDKILVSLYCKTPDENSTLSICQTSLPFYDLEPDEQEYWKSIRIKLKFKNNTIYQLKEDDPEYAFMSSSRGSIRNLVDKHPVTGDYYFYFPFFFIDQAWEGKKKIDHEAMIERLKPIIFKSKYQYHFVFNQSDLVLMDQFTTLHRRTSVSDDRLLWRIASDYKNISLL